MITLTKTHIDIPRDEFGEHDGIMEQITYECSFVEGSLPLGEMPWKYVETYCRIQNLVVR